MAQKRYGPSRGAGVAIVETEGQKQIQPGALGWAGYGGLFEKGETNKLHLITSRNDFDKKLGGIIADGTAPDNARDYFQQANGAGGLLCVRVTDGNERKATITLYQRNGDVLTPMGRLDAQNGGRWGGKIKKFSRDLDGIGGLAETTLQIGAADASSFTTDEWKGGYVELAAVSNTRYPIVGNTAAGLVSVAADQTMLADHGGGGDLRYYLVLDRDTSKELTVEVIDGEDNPDTEFGLLVYVDGDLVKKWGNLHTDPDNARYWVNVINNDDGNDEVTAVDLITGAHTAAQRPANHYGKIAAVTALVLTADIHDFTINSPGGGDPTFALGTTTDDHVAQKITITMSSATSGAAVSDVFGALGTVTLGTLFDTTTGGGGADKNKFAPPFTATAGGSPLTGGDTLVINYKPFLKDALIGGKLFPDKVNNKLDSFRIEDNNHNTITVPSGNDLTTIAAIGEYFAVQAPRPFENGRDGNADIVDADYVNQAWDVDSSPFNQVVGQNLGLVKFATPGVTSTVVEKAGIAYAAAKNHQYRFHIPSNIVTEAGAIAHVNDTIGRNDHAKVSFPTYCDVPDPNPAAAREGKRKTIPMIGMIHGREARIAVDYEGYHKAGAGVDAILPRVLKLSTGDKRLNEELLNPAGINVVVKKGGNFVSWGNRMVNTDPSFRFANHREQLSYYGNVLAESFDWIVFTINDPDTEALGYAALRSFFLPEYNKRALRGATFEDAATIKIDGENNTDATRAAGDMFADVSLQLADSTERFVIRLGSKGVTESVS